MSSRFQDFKIAMCNNQNTLVIPLIKVACVVQRPVCNVALMLQKDCRSISWKEDRTNIRTSSQNLLRRTMMDMNMLMNFAKRIALMSLILKHALTGCNVTSPFRGNTKTLFTSARQKGNKARSHERKRKKNLPCL